LGPRGGDLHERFLQLGQAIGLVDLGELRVDVETPLDQLHLTKRRLLTEPALLHTD
jgi:hypothetical protein